MAHLIKIRKGCKSPEYGKLLCSQCWMKDTADCLEGKNGVEVEKPLVCSDYDNCRLRKQPFACEWCGIWDY